MTLTLEHCKRSQLAHGLILRKEKVRIWSGQWRAWWRNAGRSYTDRVEEAGIYTGQAAWEYTSHAGPEKQIVFEFNFLDIPDERLSPVSSAGGVGGTAGSHVQEAGDGGRMVGPG